MARGRRVWKGVSRYTGAMKSTLAFGAVVAAVAASLVMAPARGEITPEATKALYEKITPSLVAVQYVFDNEQRRTEISATGVVVGDGGLVMIPAAAIPPFFPDVQLKEFKIIVPKYETDHEELDADFLGRDERTSMAFFKLKTPKDLPKVTFVDKKPSVGDRLYSVGMFPKETGYRTVITTGTVGGFFRGETPMYFFAGKQADIGGLVFNDAGEAIGYVPPQGNSPVFLSPRRGQNEDDTTYFEPAAEFLSSIAKPPVLGQPAKYPFTGIFGMAGLSKDLSEVYGLVGKPAVEIGDVIPGSPAEKAGLQKGMVVTEIDGKPIERADQPEELGGIVGKLLGKKQPGDKVVFTTIAKKGAEPKPIEVVTVERPPQPNTAKRFYAEDMGFTVREAMFVDLYSLKLPLDSKGVVLDFIKQGSQAQTARVARGDFVTQINEQPVADLASFQKMYETIRKDKPHDAIVLQVIRQGNTQVIRMEPPQ